MMIEVKLRQARLTKNTVRFEADDEDAPITVLYIKKSKLPSSPPQTILVSVEAVE